MPLHDKRKRPTPQLGDNTHIEIATALGLAMTMYVIETRPKEPLKGGYSNAFT
jgi:hypothetical protein